MGLLLLEHAYKEFDQSCNLTIAYHSDSLTQACYVGIRLKSPHHMNGLDWNPPGQHGESGGLKPKSSCN